MTILFIYDIQLSYSLCYYQIREGVDRRTWFTLKDPELSDEAHQNSIDDRVAKLKSTRV